MPSQLGLPPPITSFAHESEAEIARLLDFYHVRWEYEPTSFPLEFYEDGRLKSSFTPDFYLPDYDLYLEITTVKPGLTSRKNRKIKQLKALHPAVNIKLFTLRDLQALMLKYGRR